MTTIPIRRNGEHIEVGGLMLTPEQALQVSERLAILIGAADAQDNEEAVEMLEVA